MNTRALLVGLSIIILVGAMGLLVKQKANRTNTNNTSSSQLERTAPSGTADDMTAASPTAVTTTEPAATTSPSPSNQSSAKEFTVTASSFQFSPAQIKVKKGDTVRLTVKNSGGSHDLVIDALNVSTKILGSGQSDTVEFVANKTGSFEYYCSVSNHRAMGMVGTLVVE